MRVSISSLVFTLASVPFAAGTTHTVNPEGSGDIPTSQAAVNAAVHGDVVELTDGTFAGDGNRDIDLLGKRLTVRCQGGTPGL